MPVDVVVLVKYVPDAQEPRHLRGPFLRLDRSSSPGLLAELDEYAVEVALRVAEVHGGTVTAVTMGPDDAVEAARAALRLGADAGIHVCDERIAGSDSIGTARVLAAAVARLAPDLVVTGMASTDAATGVVPGALAQLLDLPLLALADVVDVIADPPRVRVDQDAGAAILTREAELPAVVSVTDRVGEPRYPSFKTIMAAKKKPIDTWGLDDLTLHAPGLLDEVGTAAARTRVVRAQALPPRSAARRMVDAADAPTVIADLLADLELL